MALGGGHLLQVENVFQLLESSDTVQDTRQIILENLSSSKETWLIHLLVDYYFQTQSRNIQDILAELKESQTKVLVDKLNDGIKTPETRLPALQLILFFVYKELPWCRQLVEMPIFSAIMKFLKTEVDVPILMTSLMILVILLPSVPVSVGAHLSQVFDVFSHVAALCLRKPVNAPEVFVLHLQVALYSLFHRLYGMYPCSFTAFISKFCSHKENFHVYQEVILPMVERVRLHPNLIMGHKEAETSTSRWKNRETQDIVVSCSKLSLDLIEGSREESRCPVFQTFQSVDKHRTTKHSLLPQDKMEGCGQLEHLPALNDGQGSLLANTLLLPAFDATAVGMSPSVLIGLSTPPSSQRTTPAASFLEASAGTGNVSDTSEPISRQHTPSQTDEGDKTPLSRSSSRGMIQQPKSYDSKKGATVSTPKAVTSMMAVTPGSHSHLSPMMSGGQTEASPLRSQGSAFTSPQQNRSAAVRSLQFNQVMMEGEEDEEKKAGRTALRPKHGHQEHTAESGRLDGGGKHSDLKQESHSVNQAVPMDSLHQVIISLNAHDMENADKEVEEINEKDDQFNEGGSKSSSVTTLASQTEVTAESVRQFMKKVNRIRFNSLTSNSSSSDLDNVSLTSQGVQQVARRPRSCPPLKRIALPSGDNSAGGRRARKYCYAIDRGGVGAGRVLQQKSAVEGRRTEVVPSEDSSDDISSLTGSAKDTPKKTGTCSHVQDDATIMALPEPVNPVYQYIMAPAKLAICSSCHKQALLVSNQSPGGAAPEVTIFRGNELPLFSMVSPPELLDRHLRLGSDIHAKELTKIPLTSKETTNWTHFGGMPPADEVNILRGQILLMQNQLMYERHKRTNHAKRNRRLLCRITHVAALEEDKKTLTDQIRLQEQEIQQLQDSIELLQGRNRQLLQNQESDEYEKLVQFRTSLKENKDLKAASIVLKNLLLTQKEDYDKQQKKLESIQHRNLENEQQLDICARRLADTEKLKSQVFQLQKEVLLMQELHQKCQERLQRQCVTSPNKEGHSYLTTSLKAEITELSKENKKMRNLIEAYQTRMVELDELLKSKDKAIAEVKKNFELAKSSYQEQLQAVEVRCQSLVHTSQGLETKLMDLTCRLDQDLHRKMLQATSSNSPQLSQSALADRAAGISGAEVKHDSREEEGSLRKMENEGGEQLDFTARHFMKHSGAGGSSGSGNHASRGTGVQKGISLVVATDQVSVASSTFTQDSSKGAMPTSPFRSSLTSTRSAVDLELMADSGAASRLSFRADSDVSMKSVSGHSMTTGDSGCWPKVD